MSARANVVLPAPRSPESVIRSPGASALAMSIISRSVACSSGSTTEKLAPPGLVSSIAMAGRLPLARSRRGPLARLPDLPQREDAGDGGAAADRRIERHRAAVQLHERTHQRQPKAGTAMAGAERVGLEPIEHLV